jgi:hypothetical protein
MILITSLDSSGNYVSNIVYEFQHTNLICFYCKGIYSEMSGTDVLTTLLLDNTGDGWDGYGDGYIYLGYHNSANTYIEVQAILNIVSHSSM